MPAAMFLAGMHAGKAAVALLREKKYPYFSVQSNPIHLSHLPAVSSLPNCSKASDSIIDHYKNNCMSVSKNWEARAVAGWAGNELNVSGEVNTGMLNMVPDLKRRVPQGLNPAVLMLDLHHAVDAAPENFQRAAYDEKIGRLDQYRQVEIFHQNQQIAILAITAH